MAQYRIAAVLAVDPLFRSMLLSTARLTSLCHVLLLAVHPDSWTPVRLMRLHSGLSHSHRSRQDKH